MKNKRNILSDKITREHPIYIYTDKINSNSNFVIILILQEFIILLPIMKHITMYNLNN